MPKRQRASAKTHDRAKQLRRDATAPERILWSALRSRKLGGLKFRRQHPIEPYIVDFFCATAKLIVELDGESHDGREQYDRRRDAFLRSLGFKIIRISNDDVLETLDGVAEFIYRQGSGEPLH
jgi:ATP-dependent DNA helicase RecQ